MATTTEYAKVDLRVGTDAQFQANLASLPVGAIWGSTDSKVVEDDLSDALKTKINSGAPALEIKQVTKTYTFNSTSYGTLTAREVYTYVNDTMISYNCNFMKDYYESYRCDGTLSPMFTEETWTNGTNTLSNINPSENLMKPTSGTEINTSTRNFEGFPEQLFSNYTYNSDSISFNYSESTNYLYQYVNYLNGNEVSY